MNPAFGRSVAKSSAGVLQRRYRHQGSNIYERLRLSHIRCAGFSVPRSMLPDCSGIMDCHLQDSRGFVKFLQGPANLAQYLRLFQRRFGKWQLLNRIDIDAESRSQCHQTRCQTARIPMKRDLELRRFFVPSHPAPKPLRLRWRSGLEFGVRRCRAGLEKREFFQAGFHHEQGQNVQIQFYSRRGRFA